MRCAFFRIFSVFNLVHHLFYPTKWSDLVVNASSWVGALMIWRFHSHKWSFVGEIPLNTSTQENNPLPLHIPYVERLSNALSSNNPTVIAPIAVVRIITIFFVATWLQSDLLRVQRTCLCCRFTTSPMRLSWLFSVSPWRSTATTQQCVALQQI